jgi:hypothetical protein
MEALFSTPLRPIEVFAIGVILVISAVVFYLTREGKSKGTKG